MIDYTKPSPGMKISVIGDGAWGTAIALTLLENGYRVMLWGAFPEYTEEMKKERMNYKFLPGIPLPDNLEFTNSLEEALSDARLLVMASPSQFMRSVSRQVGAAMKEPYPIVTVAKGIETDGIFLKRMSEIIEEETKCKHVSCLSGPSHAAQVARKMPAAVTVASKIPQLASFVQQVFSNEHLRVYTNSDIIGVELCGTLKNIIAIAAGAVDGLEFGTNTKSALVTRGLVEMMRFGVAMGAQVESFIGLAGIGDLMTTCNMGRNYTFGMNLVKGMSVEDALKSSAGVVEGYRNAECVYKLAKRYNISMPLTEAIYSVLYEGKDFHAIVPELMTRDLKSESHTGSPILRWLKLQALRTRITLKLS
ncbi:NAD(P)-dependent glycerol-3-phosphate dehydrogenase [bacterium]|nr:NAD(P)-dependent glycerol-3-phosphate dehydrogenase [bacterium]